MTTLYVDASISDRWQYRAKDAEAVDPRLQPHLTRLAWLVDDGDGGSNPLAIEKCHMVEIPAVLGGGGRISLSEVMRDFMTDLGTVDRIVAFGWTHHRLVLEHCLSVQTLVATAGMARPRRRDGGRGEAGAARRGGPGRQPQHHRCTATAPAGEPLHGIRGGGYRAWVDAKPGARPGPGWLPASLGGAEDLDQLR